MRCWPAWSGAGPDSTAATCREPVCTGCSPAWWPRWGFSEWTTGGQLRHPRFQGPRDDKDPADVVREMP